MDVLDRWALAARRGDEDSLNRFVAAAHDRAWRLSAALVDSQSADDLAQEVVLRAVRALATFRGDSSADTWLLAIGRHVCLDELRRRSRRRHRDRRSTDEGAAGHHLRPVADVADGVEVHDLVRRLEPARRDAFVLTQMFGLSYQEAAEICRCPVGTIRSRVARARADLIDALGERSEPGCADDPVSGSVRT